jgi:hypothetical protein
VFSSLKVSVNVLFEGKKLMEIVVGIELSTPKITNE